MRHLVALALFAAAPALAEPTPAPPMPGGWSELAPTHPELLPAARAAVRALPRLRGVRPQLQRIEGGERQVVAGMNYRMVIRLTDRSRWRVQVWRKLDGTYQLTHHERIKPVTQ